MFTDGYSHIPSLPTPKELVHIANVGAGTGHDDGAGLGITTIFVHHVFQSLGLVEHPRVIFRHSAPNVVHLPPPYEETSPRLISYPVKEAFSSLALQGGVVDNFSHHLVDHMCP